MLNYLKRRSLLKESFLFTCECRRCLDEEAETTKNFIFSDLGDLAEKNKRDAALEAAALKQAAAEAAAGVAVVPKPPARSDTDLTTVD